MNKKKEASLKIAEILSEFDVKDTLEILENLHVKFFLTSLPNSKEFFIERISQIYDECEERCNFLNLLYE